MTDLFDELLFDAPTDHGHVGPLQQDFVDVDAKTIKGLYPLKSILELTTNGYIAGGCFKNILNGDKPKDIDVFFNTPADFEVTVAEFEDEGYTVVYENDNTICYDVNGYNVELIRSQHGTVTQMLNRFDFSIVKFAVYLDANGEMYARYHVKFFEHLLQRKLVLLDTLILPVNTFERALKYTRYGYSLCLESKQLLVDAIRGSNDRVTTRDFYVGID